MTDAEILGALDDRRVLALTLWGEARGEVVEGVIAVGCVIRNRVRRLAQSYKTVCLAPEQFDCWLPTDANYPKVLAWARSFFGLAGFVPQDNPVLAECFYLADGILAGVLLDNTRGAHDYYSPAAMIPVDRVPSDAVGKTLTTIGSQRFYTA